MAEKSQALEGMKMLEEEIKCCICLGVLDDPKRLPCGHIHCKTCLQNLLQRSRDSQSTMTCPECRASVFQDSAGVLDVDRLPDVFQINRLKDTYSKLSEEINTCASPQNTDYPCPNHPSQSRNLYCNTCQELICRSCVVVVPQQHQGHKYSFIEDEVTEQTKAFVEELTPVKTFPQQASEALTKIEEVKREVRSQKDVLTQEITASFDTLHRVLDEHKQALLLDLQRLTGQKLATIETQEQEIIETSGRLKQVVESVNRAMAHNDDGREFLSKKHQLAAQLTEVASTCSQVSLNPAVESLDLETRVLLPADLKQRCALASYIRQRVPDPQVCSAIGDGLIDAEINVSSQFDVHVVNDHGNPCSGKVSVELKTLRNGAIAQPQVTACPPSHYKVSYTPTVRGRHELSIKVNGEHIPDSPFKVFVQTPVSKIKGPVAKITNLICPTGLHSTAERILVCDYVGARVAVYDQSLKRIGDIRKESSSFTPNESATDSQKNIYVSTGEDNSLHKFTKDGIHVKTVTVSDGSKRGQFSNLNGMCVFQNKLLYICDSNRNRIVVFDLDLQFLYEVNAASAHIDTPTCLDIDTNDNFYICDSLSLVDGHGQIKVLAPNGQYLYSIHHQLMSRPVTVKIVNELLYVSDANSNCVLCFTLSGHYVGSFGQGFLESPEGLAIDEDGYFYVSNNRKSVLVF